MFIQTEKFLPELLRFGSYVEGEKTFCRHWLRKTAETVADTCIYMGLIFHCLQIIVEYFLVPPNFYPVMVTMHLTVIAISGLYIWLQRSHRFAGRVILYVSQVGVCLVYALYLRSNMANDFAGGFGLVEAWTSYLLLTFVSIFACPFFGIPVVAQAVIYWLAAWAAFSTADIHFNIIIISGIAYGLTCLFQQALVLANELYARREFRTQRQIAEMLQQKASHEKELLAMDLEKSRAVNDAITKTTQMLAHDIRKPFSLINIMLAALSGQKDARKVNRVLRQFEPSLKVAFENIETMLEEVMDLGRKRAVLPVASDFAAHLRDLLQQLFAMDEKTIVDFRYEFAHSGLTLIDSPQMSRVLKNIIENAVQAQKHRGTVSFRTLDANGPDGPVTRIEIQNFGPVIPSEELHMIFQPFFTKGKVEGTGLGLAISQKIVNAHGGSIGCSSDPESGTTFWLTLPAREGQTAAVYPSLPASTREIYESFSRTRTDPGDDAMRQIRIQEGEKARQICDTLKAADRKITILMVDDEPIYCDAVRSQLDEFSELVSSIDFITARTYSEAVSAMHDSAVDLIITDIHLKDPEGDGFGIVKHVTANFPDCYINIHSNSSSRNTFGDAFRCGAHSFLPKPMSRLQLISLLEECIQKGTPDTAVSAAS